MARSISAANRRRIHGRGRPVVESSQNPCQAGANHTQVEIGAVGRQKQEPTPIGLEQRGRPPKTKHGAEDHCTRLITGPVKVGNFTSALFGIFNSALTGGGSIRNSVYEAQPTVNGVWAPRFLRLIFCVLNFCDVILVVEQEGFSPWRLRRSFSGRLVW